jgi:16S rRNA (uracil1498-N3)-methyltransferase
MSSRRFMINSRDIDGGIASLGGELYRHIVRVLRLTAGDALTLVDENGWEHAGAIEQVARETVAIRITGSTNEPHREDKELRITLCQALPKGDKIDLILQKGTELGAHDFWLFGGRRSIARVNEDQRTGKLERWRRIAAEAARQCARRTLPAIRWYSTAEEVSAAATHDHRLILWENEQTYGLKDALAGIAAPGSVIVVIGPEGGFDRQETGLFAAHGFRSVSLGPRIVRTETAAIAIMAILQYLYEDV